MSLPPDNGVGAISPSVSSHPLAADALQPMGRISESVAQHFPRKCDFYAATSIQKAKTVLKIECFEEEIISVEMIQNQSRNHRR